MVARNATTSARTIDTSPPGSTDSSTTMDNSPDSAGTGNHAGASGVNSRASDFTYVAVKPVMASRSSSDAVRPTPFE